MRLLAAVAATLTLAIVLGGCTPAGEVTTGRAKAAYLGQRTVLLDRDMVSFLVAMRGAGSKADVEAYGRCAAAQYALIRGAGFVRHVRTTVTRSGEVWNGDAVYLVSAALPRGTHTIDAEVTVRDCGEQRIPTV